MDYAAALQQLLPGTQWTCGDTYASVQMLDGTPKPSEADLIAAYSVWVSAAPTRFKTAAKAVYDSAGQNPAVLRAIVATVMDELNNLRQWITAYKAAVAASSSLADMKTRVAALPNVPDRTPAQARTSIFSKIDA